MQTSMCCLAGTICVAFRTKISHSVNHAVLYHLSYAWFFWKFFRSLAFNEVILLENMTEKVSFEFIV